MGVVLKDVSKPTYEELLEQLAELQKQKQQKIVLKVSDKTGALMVTGLQRFPITLYASQWERLLAEKDAILAYISANATRLSRKPT